MEDDEFCQMFLYTLINLICFLLSTINLTCLYNVNSQIKILRIESASKYESYRNSYTAISVLFTFDPNIKYAIETTKDFKFVVQEFIVLYHI